MKAFLFLKRIVLHGFLIFSPSSQSVKCEKERGGRKWKKVHYFASLMWKCQQEMHTSSQDFFVSSISAKGCHEKRVSCSHTGKRGTLAHMNAESIFRLCFLSVYKHARTNTTSFVPISIRCRTKSHVVVVTDVDIDRCLISFSGRPDCDSERASISSPLSLEDSLASSSSGYSANDDTEMQ